MSPPTELTKAVSKCMTETGEFEFQHWGSDGLSEINPLWLLKYLPNMPASHVAIYNNLRGPNNSITMREASPGAAITEAYSTISRGHADVLIVGATGARIHPVRSLHAALQEQLAVSRDDPTTMSRPFDVSRDGSVLGEGAGAIVCETLQHAQNRGATILGEIVGYGSTAVGPQAADDFIRQAVINALRASLGDADPKSIGHIHAHGLATTDSDRQEAEAIAEVFGPAADQPPVTTAKGHIGNLGAGSGMVEFIASLLAMGGELFPIRNCQSLDPACPINACMTNDVPAGDSFINVNVTPQGQATATRVQRLTA
jgi:3-oxoacyl-[acyl-carrier-protein] synthase II